MNSLRRRVMGRLGKEYPFVDLGLPSGLLWAQYDIGADEIGGVGHYFQWGNIVGYKYNSGYDYSQATYDYTPGSALTGSIQPDDIDHDAALAECGSPWRMPTIDNFKELVNSSYTNQSWTTINGRPGWLITSKINGNTLFLPANGSFYGGTQRFDYDTAGTFWSSTISSLSGYALRLHVNTSALSTDNQSPRYQGFFIRPVRYPAMNYVDLGLPSGIKWATCNLGASAPEAAGLYFSWGNIVGHKATDGYNFSSAVYANTPGAALTVDIASDDIDHDAALANWGSPWRIPTAENCKELFANTIHEWGTYNGVNGRFFYKKVNNQKVADTYIFIPAAGYLDEVGRYNYGQWGYHTSSTKKSTSDRYYMLFSYNAVDPQSTSYKYIGFPIRPVYDPSL